MASKRASEVANNKHPRSEVTSDSLTESVTALAAQTKPEEVQAQQTREHRDLHQDRQGQRREGSSQRPEEQQVRSAVTDGRNARQEIQARPDKAQLKSTKKELPEEPSLTSLNALVRQVRQKQAVRHARRQRFLSAKRRRDARVHRKFASLVQRTSFGGGTLTGVTSARASSSGPTASQAGHRGRHVAGDQGVRGGQPNLGMKFYISGRRVKRSRVVRPPELVSIPKIRCRINSLMVTPATVRMLVERTGRVGFAYIKHSSSSKVFDRCALRHTKQMRFKPGEDQHGAPLNVWINVRVEPGTLSAGL
jgi:TonB family protein